MRKKSDYEVIAERYTSQVLNEMVPPFEYGSDSGDYGTGDVSPEGKYKAVHRPSYSDTNEGLRHYLQQPDVPGMLGALIAGLSAELEEIITSSGGRVEDSRPEMQMRIASMINAEITGPDGKPLFKSHAKHIARNILDALEKSGALKEVDKSRAPSAKKSQYAAGGEISFGKYGKK